MLDQLRQDDVVVVWKLDGLSRSLKDLLVIMDRIHQVGVAFKSLTDAMDITTPAERMMIQIVEAFGEFEREMIRERTKVGLAVAKDEGQTGERRPSLRDEQRTDIIKSILSIRKTGEQMARLYNVGEATISRVMATSRQVLVRD